MTTLEIENNKYTFRHYSQTGAWFENGESEYDCSNMETESEAKSMRHLRLGRCQIVLKVDKEGIIVAVYNDLIYPKNEETFYTGGRGVDIPSWAKVGLKAPN